MTRLNSPERILRGLSEVPLYISNVDEALGAVRVRRFAELLSGLLAHTEDGALLELADRPGGTSVFLHIISSATEFQTAWNVLRIANIPAAQRQSRVAMETGAFAVLLALPRRELIRLPNSLALVKCLEANQGVDLEKLYEPSVRTQGTKVVKTAPRLRGSAIYPAFLAAARDILGIPQNVVENLREYNREVQHTASHSSVELWLHHFDGFEKLPLAGAFYSPERVESYKETADDLINLVGWLEVVIRRVENYLEQAE